MRPIRFTAPFLISTLFVFSPILSFFFLTAQVLPAYGQAVSGQTTTGAGTAVSGQTTTNTGTSLTNPLNVSTLQGLLTAILGGVVTLGTIFLIFMMVYVGFLFVAARGNEEKIRSAREALIWTVIGGLILIGAQAISLVIQTTVGTVSGS